MAQKREPQSSGAPHSQRAVFGTPGARLRGAEEDVELVDARLEPDQLGAALEQQVLAEAVAPVHLQREPAQVAELLLAQAQERAAVAAGSAAARLGVRRRLRLAAARDGARRQEPVSSGRRGIVPRSAPRRRV